MAPDQLQTGPMLLQDRSRGNVQVNGRPLGTTCNPVGMPHLGPAVVYWAGRQGYGPFKFMSLAGGITAPTRADDFWPHPLARLRDLLVSGEQKSDACATTSGEAAPPATRVMKSLRKRIRRWQCNARTWVNGRGSCSRCPLRARSG